MSRAQVNPYVVLGVPDDATIEQIRKAYRKKARATHPDHGGSAENFHEVTEAYQLLTDASARQTYDRRNKGESASKAAPSQPRGAQPTRAQPSSDSRGFGKTPVFRPAFDPATPPVLPLSLAGRQSHSAPRPPSFLQRLNSTRLAQHDAEERTVELLQTTILGEYPAARLVNGVRFDDGAEAGSILVGGYRVAVVASLIASAQAYRWNGRELLHKGRTVGGPALQETVRAVQGYLPGCHVSGWLVLHNLNGNPFEPVIDYPPGTDRSALAPVHAVNAGTLPRHLRQFMLAGPQFNVVQLPVLARLLEATS